MMDFGIIRTTEGDAVNDNDDVIFSYADKH